MTSILKKIIHTFSFGIFFKPEPPKPYDGPSWYIKQSHQNAFWIVYLTADGRWKKHEHYIKHPVGGYDYWTTQFFSTMEDAKKFWEDVLEKERLEVEQEQYRLDNYVNVYVPPEFKKKKSTEKK